MRISSISFVVISLAGIFSSDVSTRASEPHRMAEPRLAIRGARVMTAPGRVIEKGTVILRGRIIESVGANIDVPADATVIEAEGLFLYSGFTDAHAHFGLTLPTKPEDPEGKVDFRKDAHPATLETNRRGIWPALAASEFLVLDEKGGEEYRKQGFTSALLAPKDGFLAGTSAWVSLAGRARRESLIQDRAALHASFSSSGEGYPSALMGAIAHLRQAFYDAQGYARDWAWFRRQASGAQRPPLDADLEAMREAVAGTQPVVFLANTENQIRRALALAREFKWKLVISGGAQAWKCAQDLVRENVPVLLALDFAKEPKEAKAAENAEDEDARVPEPKRLFEDRKRRWEESVANAAALEKAGVRFAFTSAGCKNISEFVKNLRIAMEKGLSEGAAVAALSSAPAEIFGLAAQRGVIEAGKAADLVAFDAALGSKDASVRFLFAEGRKFEFEKKKDAKNKEKKEEKKDAANAETAPANPTNVDPTAQRPVELESDRIPATKTGGNVFICNATILPVVGAKIENGGLLIENGRITKMGKGLTAPSGVTVIDAAGKFVIPGIIDCHSHMAIEGGVNEGSLSLTAECRIADVIEPQDVAIYRALAGGVTVAHLLHGSANVVGGQDANIKLKFGRPAEEMRISDSIAGIKFALGENPKQSNWGNRGSRFPNTRMGVEAVLLRAFRMAQEYRDARAAFAKDKAAGLDPREPRFDLRLQALSDILDHKILVHSHCYRAEEILMLIRVADLFGWKIQTLQHALEAYKVAPEIAAHGAAVSTFSDWWAYKHEAYDAIPWNGELCVQAGISTSFNSDSDEMVRRMNLEAAKGVKYGNLSEEQALALVTLEAARQLGIAHRAGSLELGKDGDIAIFEGHPFSVYSRCVMTLIEGEVYFERRDTWKKPAAATPREAATIDAAVVKMEPKSDVSSERGKEFLDSATVIFGGTIYPISAEPIEKGMVILRGNRIEAVGKNLPIPQGARIVEAAGLRIYPGLIDAGTRIGLTEIGSVHGTNDIHEIGDFQPDLMVATAVNPHSEHIPVTRINGVTAALVTPAGAQISGQSAFVRLEGWVPAEMIVEPAVAMHVQFPSVRERREEDEDEEAKKRDEETETSIRELSEHFRKAKEYGRICEAAPASLPYDPQLEALAPYAMGRKPVIVSVDREAQIRRAVKWASELGIKIILSGGRDAWKVADLLKKKEIPVLVGPVHSLPSSEFDPYDAPFHNAAALYEAGVPFAFQTLESSNVRNLPYHAGTAAAYGLPAGEALRAVTISPAQILGVADRLGSLEAGKEATLIVTDGDPLEICTQIRRVFIAGKEIPLETRQTQLRERFLKRIQSQPR